MKVTQFSPGQFENKIGTSHMWPPFPVHGTQHSSAERRNRQSCLNIYLCNFCINNPQPPILVCPFTNCIPIRYINLHLFHCPHSPNGPQPCSLSFLFKAVSLSQTHTLVGLGTCALEPKLIRLYPAVESSPENFSAWPGHPHPQGYCAVFVYLYVYR